MDKTCNYCKYWLNDTDEVLISVCTKGMIVGSCWFDNSCKKWKLKTELKTNLKKT